MASPSHNGKLQLDGIPVPKLDLRASNMPLEWHNFATSLKIYLRATGLEQSEDTRKFAVMLQFIGKEGIYIFNSFNVDLDKITFKELTSKFEQHFVPKINTSIERHKLFNRKQQADEDLENYATDLKNISLQCEFGELADDLLKDIFSWNIHPSLAYIKEKILIQKPKTFDEALELAKIIRNTKKDASKTNSHLKSIVNQQINKLQKRQSHNNSRILQTVHR